MTAHVTVGSELPFMTDGSLGRLNACTRSGRIPALSRIAKHEARQQRAGKQGSVNSCDIHKNNHPFQPEESTSSRGEGEPKPSISTKEKTLNSGESKQRYIHPINQPFRVEEIFLSRGERTPRCIDLSAIA